ncbi:MAG: isochorismatase family protein [Candidatus Pacebacteria bacterium]|nr:isochorismatase family protein [Candidatus Paceibacterota bacterium]
MQIKIVSTDFQKDFTSEGGRCYRQRPSVNFVKNTLVPFLENRNLKVAEIISDYRQPRPGDRGDCCRPGEWGYESEIPEAVKDKNIWIKCMNSPIWIRDNIGDQSKRPGLPHQDPEKFSAWIEQEIGKMDDTGILLIGLTLDCCVLCAAQEFNFRGYEVKILKEAVDVYTGSLEEKETICKTPVGNWADVITWEEAKRLLS